MFKSQTVSCFVLNGGLTWKFNLGGAPWWGEFRERLVGMIKKCLKKPIGSERLLVTELPTVLFEIENVLNNRPFCFMYDDDVSEVLTPNSLLYGGKFEFENKCADEGYFEVVEGTESWLRKCAVQKVFESF